MSSSPKNPLTTGWVESMIKKIDHIGIAVKSLEQVKQLYKAVFNLEPHFEETVPDQKVRAAGIRIGESNLEFLEATSPDSPVAKFIEKRGEGMHHICLAVENIEQVLENMRQNGLELIDEKPRIGAEGKRIAFVHPRSMNGILVELSEEG